MPPEPQRAAESRRARLTLLGAVAVTLALYYVPFGRLIGWPLFLLSTLAHEAGHGVAAILAGGSFESLRMWADASGVARVSGLSRGADVGLFAAGGLVGPGCAAALLFVAARREKPARVALWVLAGLLALALLLVVRGGFAMVFVAVLAACLAALGAWTRGAVPQFALGFLAVQLALTVFSRADYLFMREARTGGGTMPSDVAQMASALGGPYWLWGFLCGAFSVVVLVAGLTFFLVGLPRLRRKAAA